MAATVVKATSVGPAPVGVGIYGLLYGSNYLTVTSVMMRVAFPFPGSTPVTTPTATVTTPVGFVVVVSFFSCVGACLLDS